MQNWQKNRNYRKYENEDGSFRYVITVDGEDIEVSEEIYREYAKIGRKIEYIEFDLKRNRVLQDADGKAVIGRDGLPVILVEREVSFDKLIDEDWEFPSSVQSPENIFIEAECSEILELHRCVALLTEKEQALSRRKIRLTAGNHANMAAKIYARQICGDGTHTTDKKPDEQKNKNSLLNTANYIFKEILPLHGYAVREKQIELAEHILETIRRKGISLAESEVGTGKTHAYLIAAVLAKRGRLNDSWLRGRCTSQSWTDSAYMVHYKCYYCKRSAEKEEEFNYDMGVYDNLHKDV